MTSVARRHDDSGEYSEGSQDIEHNNSGNDVGQAESDYDSQGSDSDRSDRDPDAQETERRVDDDEDRSNPQYIPKRGTFYEHDDRTAASGEESANTTSDLSVEKKEGSEPATERRRAPRKSDVINKWSHDKYNENEQMPKSRDELVSIYGYDIRNEDAPPHARRNRRYGRGPNKYTRTWEDEEAYKRQTAAAAAPRKPPTLEDFPHLDAANNRNRKPRTPRPRSKSQPNNSNESLGPSENGSLRRNPSLKTAKKPIIIKQNPVKPMAKTPIKPMPKREGREGRDGRDGREGRDLREVRDGRDGREGRDLREVRDGRDGRDPRDSREERREVRGEEKKMPALENLTITASVGNSQGQPQRKVAAVGQQRPVPTEIAKKPAHHQPLPQSNPPQNKPLPQQQPPPQQQKQQQQQQQSQQQQPAGGGSKRYSSLRQRPLAENYVPQPQPQPNQPPLQQQQNQLQQQQQQLRYNAASTAPEFTPTGAAPPPAQHPQQLLHQQVHRGAAQHAASPPHQHATPHPQQQRLILEQQPPQLVAHHALHNLPPQHQISTHGQLQPTQGYAPPAMMPAQYMQSGSGAVFPGAALYAAPAAQYTHPQIYPHHNYATTAGGVTYFSCAEQEQAPAAPRAVRRPTAAIPIVKPHHERAPNSSEKDNIDRIVENMFVRKPWPTTHSDSKEKSQSERSSQEPPSKDQSQPNSLTSSSISTDSKPSESREPEETPEERKDDNPKESQSNETVSNQTQANLTQGNLPQGSLPQGSLPQGSLPQGSQSQSAQSQPTQANQESISTDA